MAPKRGHQAGQAQSQHTVEARLGNIGATYFNPQALRISDVLRDVVDRKIQMVCADDEVTIGEGKGPCRKRIVTGWGYPAAWISVECYGTAQVIGGPDPAQLC